MNPNYEIIFNRLQSAINTQELKKLEKSIENLYNNGIFNAIELQKLDSELLEQYITLSMNNGLMKELKALFALLPDWVLNERHSCLQSIENYYGVYSIHFIDGYFILTHSIYFNQELLKSKSIEEIMSKANLLTV